MLFLVDKSCLPRLHQRPFESLGEFRGVADVKGYAMPAGMFVAVLILPHGANSNDIAALEVVEAYADSFGLVTSPFGDNDRLIFLHISLCSRFSRFAS
jgi:hypothetical protein